MSGCDYVTKAENVNISVTFDNNPHHQPTHPSSPTRLPNRPWYHVSGLPQQNSINKTRHFDNRKARYALGRSLLVPTLPAFQLVLSSRVSSRLLSRVSSFPSVPHFTPQDTYIAPTRPKAVT